jgi:hypothetical protein
MGNMRLETKHEFDVLSFEHQAVKTAGKNCVIAAVEKDSEKEVATFGKYSRRYSRIPATPTSLSLSSNTIIIDGDMDDMPEEYAMAPSYALQLIMHQTQDHIDGLLFVIDGDNLKLKALIAALGAIRVSEDILNKYECWDEPTKDIVLKETRDLLLLEVKKSN